MLRVLIPPEGMLGFAASEFATEFRDEVFLPFLLEDMRERYSPSASSGLHRITFQSKRLSSKEWREWYAEHRTEARADWARMATDSLRQLLDAGDMSCVKTELQANRECWADILMLPAMKLCLRHDELHDEVAMWLEETYRPAWYKPLRELARQLLHDGHLSPELAQKLAYFDDETVDDASWVRSVRSWFRITHTYTYRESHADR